MLITVCVDSIMGTFLTKYMWIKIVTIIHRLANVLDSGGNSGREGACKSCSFVYSTSTSWKNTFKGYSNLLNDRWTPLDSP